MLTNIGNNDTSNLYSFYCRSSGSSDAASGATVSPGTPKYHEQQQYSP